MSIEFWIFVWNLVFCFVWMFSSKYLVLMYNVNLDKLKFLKDYLNKWNRIDIWMGYLFILIVGDRI